MAESTPQTTTAPASGGGRSIAFPFIPLESAIKRARQIWDHEGKNLAPITAAAAHWDYGTKSSGLRQTVSALKQYGLVQDSGNGDDRMIRLTERALDILLEPDDSPKREASIRAAALAPKIYKELLTLWDAKQLPSDATMTAYLLREKDFNRNAVADFLKDFRANIQFAKLASSDSMSSSASREEAANGKSKIAVGQLVQWESGGVLQFPLPRRVTALLEGGKFATVEGSDTGLPVGELAVIEGKPPGTTPQAPAPAAPQLRLVGDAKSQVFRQDVYNFADGGSVILQWPESMSKESFGEFEDWIELQVRKIKRASGVTEDKKK